MPTETEQLVVSLEARIKDFEKNFIKANRTANDNFSNIEKRAKQSADTLEKSMGRSSASIAAQIEGAFKPLMSGGVLAAGVTAAATAIKKVAESIAEVDREASKAGVTSKVWQQWSYVAKASGASIDGVTDALKEMNIRSSEFAQTGTGSASDAFKRLGYTAADVAHKIKDPNAFLDELIGKLQQLSAADRTFALDDLFGGTGAEQLAKVLDKSVGEIQKMRSEAALFTPEQIEAAKKIDAAWETMWLNVSVYAKQAAINGVGYAQQIVDVISTLKGDKLIEASKNAAIANANSPETQLKGLLAQKQALQKQIEDVKATASSNFLAPAELRQLESSLRAVEDQITVLKGGMSGLNGTVTSSKTALENSTLAAKNFKTALSELKALVPDLKADLDTLSQAKTIDATYLKTVLNARTIGDVMSATSIADQAKTSSRVNAAKSNTTTYLEGYLTPGKSNASVEGMQSDFAQKLATMMASMPDGLRGQISINSGYRDVQRQQELWIEALKKYGSPEAARKWVAPPGNSQHNKGNAADLGYGSPEAMKWAHDNAESFGLTFPLSNENWHIEDRNARNTAKGAELDKQTEARKQLNQAVQESLSLAQFEQSISSMSASQQQTELAVFKAKQDAQRSGVTLSEQELDSIRQRITLTNQLNKTNEQVRVSAAGMTTAQNFFAESFASSLTGLIQGTTTFNQALQNLVSSIASAALQAALLGQGPLAGLLGGSSTSSSGKTGGIIGGLFSALFSADGGPVNRARMTPLHLAGGGSVRGPGTSKSDSIPAMLSDGEFVVNAAATSKNRAALEAINSGKTPKIGMGKIGGNGGVASQVNTISNVFSPTIPITVQASGNKETDGRLTASLQTELNTLMENKMTEFTQNQQRSGGMLNRKRFT